jgi:spore coat polysaccharide biosynthesis protein SpsF
MVERPLDVHVATTELAEDDPIVAACAAEDVPVFRGSGDDVDDVLRRFVDCLDTLPSPPELVLRICADRPFLCPRLVEELLDAYDELGAPDYLANTLERSYPYGLDLELVRADALRQAHAETADPYDREHVTPFLYRQPERFRLSGLTCPWGNFGDVAISLDTEAEYRRLLALHARLPLDFDHLDVLSAVALAPELAR